jgi:hypothetical protein
LKQNAILIELQYLPPVQYFTMLFSYETVFIEQHEHYVKRSYRNRCHIATANGIQRLSIPLKKGKNEQQPIREVRISYDENWQKNHWSAICTAYSNAPFFEHYENIFQPFFSRKFKFLFDLNVELLQMTLEILDFRKHLEYSVTYEKNVPPSVLDCRNVIVPQSGHKLEAPGFNAAKYPQVFEEKNGFIPNLSILDLIFCTGPQASFYIENSSRS